MCGICGIVDYQGGGADFERRLPPMVTSLRHRGPDQSGTWRNDHAALGHARLSIIDLTDGRQPLSNEDDTVWIAYNGEVYNFSEMRDDLRSRGHQFRTGTDTEVIVHLYEEHGIDCVQHLRGMFAFAIWDGNRGEMYLVRDRIGIKPLYYTVQGGRLIFGSEIKAILAHGDVPRSVRPDALSDYLTFLYSPAPKTMFEGIYKLEPGHWLRFSREGMTANQYWDLEVSEFDGKDRKTVEAELIEQLSDAVNVRLVSDVPLGAFLSGGVDSSAVVAMMAQAGHRPLVTTSIGFDEQKYNELPYARRVAQRYETEHHEHIVRSDAVSVVEKLAWHYDEPFADYSAIPTYYVSQAARQHVTVALSGDGGDENFAGYRRYRFDLHERRVRRLIPRWLRRGVIGPLAAIYPKGDWMPRPLRAKATLRNLSVDAATAYCQSVGFIADCDKSRFLSGDLAKRLGDYRSADVIRRHMDNRSGTDLDQLLYTDFKTWLPDDMLTKVDRASMAVSLEVRVPLLDHLFVEYVNNVPGRMKIESGQGKAVLKSALRPYLDDEILYRTKQGFTPPIIEWLRGDLREMVGDLLEDRNAFYADYLAREGVLKAFRAHCAGYRNYAPLLWAVLMFELWGRQFVRGSAAGGTWRGDMI